ncbi:MAG: hypothetical protein WC248_02320 [Candidatus Methanomethylophilaceae archaeon]|jgi:hypothetical protein
MSQEKTSEIPVEIKAVRLEKWFSGLSDQDRIKLRRYLSNVVVSSEIGFFMDIIKAALADENYSFAVMMCQEAYNIDITEIQMFFVNEELIDAYIGAERYEDAKAACDANLKLYPVISKEFIKVNGGKLPEKINFRNRMIDVLVGIEFNYDKAYEMLDTYFRMNLISEEDLLLRKQSLRTHRLQRSFDSIYTYRPVNDLKN